MFAIQLQIIFTNFAITFYKPRKNKKRIYEEIV